jgi:glycosyltransferase involved in cell wall biosynthesis
MSKVIDKTKISIITVVYNGAKTLEQTILSVINQTYKNIEYIIIDGGSTDGTIDIIKKHEDKISFWISEKDKGLYDAMNKGIGYAKGEIIGMINSDDWYELNAVELIVDAYKNNPDKKIFHGDRYDILQDGQKRLRRFNPSRFKFLYYGMTYNHPSMFVHKEIYRNHLFNTELKVLSDFEFVLSAYLKNFNQFHYIPLPYVDYRLDGISGNISLKTMISEGYVARKNAGLPLLKNLLSLVIRLNFWIFSKIILRQKSK